MLASGHVIATQKVPVLSFVGSGTGTVGAAYSFTETVPADATILLVPHSWSNGTNSLITTSVTAGGVSMSNAFSPRTFGANYRAHKMVYLLNPPTGSVTITVSANSYTGTTLTANAIAYTNCRSVGTGAAVNGSGTTASQSSISSGPGQLVVNSMSYQLVGAGTGVTGYTQQLRYNLAGVSGTNWSLVIGDAVGESSTSFSATLPSSVGWASGYLILNA